jgi:arabinosaccharide transport system substrate-binding protein
MAKRLLASLLTVAMIATLMVGCGGNKSQQNAAATTDEAANTESTTNAEPTTLTFWTFNELHTGFMDDAVKTWNEKNPDRQIELKKDVYPVDENHNKLLIALQSGRGAPDIVDIEIGQFANFLKGNDIGLAELNRVVEPVKDQLIMSRMDNYAKDGKYYGIDYHVGAQVMYYNTEILSAAGVDPDSIKTWDDYLAASKQVLEKTGKPMATLETTDHWCYYPLIVLQGSDYLTKEDVGQLDNEVNISTLTMLKQMLTDGTAVLAPGGSYHAEEYWAWMNKGNCASIWAPMWYMSRFTSYMPDLKGKMIVRPMPTFNGGHKSAGMGGTGTAVTTQSENVDLAVDFLADAKLTKEGSIKTWTMLGFDPIRKDAWTDPAMQEDNVYTDYFGKDVFNTVSSITDDIQGINMTSKYPIALSLIQKNVLFKVFKEGSQTPEEALKEANEELNRE